MAMIYHCCDELRRNAIKGHPTLNGIDFLEVVDDPGNPLIEPQTVLAVHLINDFNPADLPTIRAVTEGGERIRHIAVTSIALPTPAAIPPRVLIVTVAEAGDFSTYTLRLVQGLQSKNPPPGFDPILSAIDFSFKVNCPSDFDCEPAPTLPGKPQMASEINYLAKDYASFRQLMLDRMSLLVPDWQERNPADLGITLIEMLAYVGDQLSYQQDATGTEAYLHTARKRTSVRRHARLVDYFMHDGCNARVWVQVQLDPAVPSLVLKREDGGRKTQFLTKVRDLDGNPAFAIDSDRHRKTLAAGTQVFELMHDETLFSAHNEMVFYTWGNADCCLPIGATTASLAGNFPDLKPGQVLVLAEMKGPKTGSPNDADPAHRHIVRLVDVSWPNDPLGIPTTPGGPLPAGITPDVTTIVWHPADALPFALCLSSKSGTESFSDVSKVLGNIVLADHGLTVQDGVNSSLSPEMVPASTLNWPRISTNHCEESTPKPIPARYRPQLVQGAITQAAPFDSGNRAASARSVMRWSMRDPLPEIRLREQSASALAAEIWEPRRDLLDSKATDKQFVVEIETDGVALLRFGDGIQGARPVSGTRFLATYRVGNGPRGNIGAEKLVYLATNDTTILTNPPGIISSSNPLPAQGGTAPETMEEVRQKAPYAFRRQERAVTPADYEMLARQVNETVQQTACTFRWTGSWRTAFLSVDRLGGAEVDAGFEQDLRAGLERYRMAGYDLEVDGPQYVPLEISMTICLDGNYFASQVKAALLRVFSRAYQPNGRVGLFHPDNFTFGQTVFLSRFYAAAQATAGVLSVEITTFRRQGSTDTEGLTTGKIKLGQLEIARLDNDPNFPDRGLFTITTKGGR
ncbi:MAG: putative baseplate assembly protein [Rudanella sp.]|nr:putative baseplate assembly protein [Rudanella sp.]